MARGELPGPATEKRKKNGEMKTREEGGDRGGGGDMDIHLEGRGGGGGRVVDLGWNDVIRHPSCCYYI